LDKILNAQRLAVADLLPSTRGMLLSEQMGEKGEVPLVAHSTALLEPYIRMSSVQKMVGFPANLLSGLRSRCTPARRQWERFVAVRVTQADALPMTPILRQDALVVIDRHYNSLVAYRPGEVNLYAAGSDGRLVIRYADYQAERLILRTRDPAIPAEVIEVGDGESVGGLIAGRVALVLNEV
jgi:hypothetical protein